MHLCTNSWIWGDRNERKQGQPQDNPYGQKIKWWKLRKAVTIFYFSLGSDVEYIKAEGKLDVWEERTERSEPRPLTPLMEDLLTKVQGELARCCCCNIRSSDNCQGGKGPRCQTLLASYWLLGFWEVIREPIRSSEKCPKNDCSKDFCTNGGSWQIATAPCFHICPPSRQFIKQIRVLNIWL